MKIFASQFYATKQLLKITAYNVVLILSKSEIPPGAFNKEKVKVSIVSEYYIFMAEASVSKMLRDHHYPWEAAGSGRAGVSCVLCRYVDMLGGAR